MYYESTGERLENDAAYMSGMRRKQSCDYLRDKHFREGGNSGCKGPEVGPCLKSFKVSKESAAAGW